MKLVQDVLEYLLLLVVFLQLDEELALNILVNI